jgi:predicted Zn-dependent peptidase
MTTLTRHFPATLALFAGCLTAPAFTEERLRQAVKIFGRPCAARTTIPRRWPPETAPRRLRRPSPGRHPTPEDVAAITRERS